MTRVQLSTSLDPQIARFADAFVQYTLDAIDPQKLISQSMDFDAFNCPTHVIAFGKAAASMALGCRAELGTLFVDGIVLCPDEQIPEDTESLGLSFFGVDHPSPSERNIEATKAVIQYASAIPPEHACVVCISGGGSAHLCAPSPGVSLNEIIATTKRLNQTGASIQELNTARRKLETLKGGGLARLLGHLEHVEACVLSDVMGDDPDTIASGPMRDDSHPITHTVIGNHLVLRDACGSFVQHIDPEIKVQSMDAIGEASGAGQTLANSFKQSSQSVCVATGETTVDASGTEGIGGPCMESVLAAGLELTQSNLSDWVVIGMASDGIDGPTQAAGAILTNEMLGVNGVMEAAQRALSDHDAFRFFHSIGADIVTGPTGTNVNDVVMICPKILTEAFKIAPK